MELLRIRHSNIGFVFQNFNLMNALIARENVEVAMNLKGKRGSEARKRVTELLISLDLQDRLDFYPPDLSGRERQRVSIASAFANDPPILLADEPTGNLDSRTGHAVIELFRHLANDQRKAMGVVTHDWRIESLADRVLLLEDGRLRDQG